MTELFQVVQEALLSRKEVLEREAGGRSHAREELVQIDAALSRIAKGSYGHCEGCGHAIGRHRLRAVPLERFCQACRPGERAE